MAKDNKLFHESWHRIAGERIGLRPSVQVRRQFYRGRKWYVLQDPFSNQFYRLRPNAYEFVSRLGSGRSVAEVWNRMSEKDPDNAPGQGDIIELLAQLYHANLLHYGIAPDSEKLFERYSKRKQKELTGKLMSAMFIRIPLFDPNPLLVRIQPLIRLLFSPYGLALWLLVVGTGIKLVVDVFAAAKVQTQGILAPGNLFLLYAGLALIKTLHEFGHACAVRRFGGEVHTMGVMFLIFSPLPYMDATAAWAFRSKWKRVLVGLSGMIFETFVAALATFAWAKTSNGLVHSLAYNMMFVASVSTVVFNINPLLRMDGYYILSDLLDMPNLQRQAQAHLLYLVEKYAFKVKDCFSPAADRKEAWILSLFGILSSTYRVFVFTAILFFVADFFLLAGVIMAAFCFVSWVIAPAVKLVRYFATSPQLTRTRPRAIAVASGCFAFVLTLTSLLPFPYNFKSPGVLKSVDYQLTSNKTRGYVAHVVARSGSRVAAGDTLLTMENPELMLQIQETQGALTEYQARRLQAMQESQADIKPLEHRIGFFEKRLAQLNEDRDNLILRAGATGIWVSTDSRDFDGMWVEKGTALGQLIQPDRFYFVSVVTQEDASRLFARNIRSARVKLTGQADADVEVTDYKAIPMEHTELPSTALGWGGGGEVAVSTKDKGATKSAEPFFEVRAFVAPNPDVLCYHGRSGKIMFTLPPEPLIVQGWLKFRQVLQKRYMI